MKRIQLDGAWKLQNGSELGDVHPENINYAMDGWIDAKVPGTVQQAYLDQGILPHPFIEENAKLCGFLEKEIFWYRKEFFIPSKFMGEKYTLDFEGLDTFTTLYFNGKEIGRTNNAFVPHSFDVSPYLRLGAFNVIAVKIESSINTVQKKVQDFKNMGYSNIFGSEDFSRVYIRRPQVSFGWDFAPRLVNAGIWRSVHLTAHSCVSIQNMYSKTVEISKKSATVEFDISLEKNIPGSVECEIEITISKGSTRIQKKVPYRLKPSQTNVTERIQIIVNKPQLWYPHTIGKPVLYAAKIQIIKSDTVLDSMTERFGIRKLEVVQEVAGEKRFTFMINGIPVFCKGANWVPADAITTDASPEKYRFLLTKAKDGNLNMLRIWGGGTFEHDLFYDLCDELGIMIWQDFMFACAMYPDHDPDFMANVEQETRKAVTRLRNHPSLVLWCGNNENQMGWYSWGWNKFFPRHYGEIIYQKLLPGICAELDPTRLYHPGSPYGGTDPNSYDEGDCHDWRIWHRQLPYRAFDENTSRFVSEYGLQGAPHMDTIKKYLKKDHLWPLNPTWEFHHLKIDYMKAYLNEFGTPQSAEDYVLYTQMAQAHTYKYAIESFRQRMPQCSGSLFWQWNDPWPTTCWSVIDYYHKPKAAYYWSKKAYQNVYPIFKQNKNGALEVWVVNDTIKKIPAKLELILDEFNGQYSDKYVIDITVAPCASKKVLENALTYFKLKNPGIEVLRARLLFNNQEMDNAFYFVPFVEQKLEKAEIKVWKTTEKKHTQVILKSDKLVRMVELKTSTEDLWFSDNYFDLYPGESKVVTIPGNLPLKVFIKGFNSEQVVV